MFDPICHFSSVKICKNFYLNTLKGNLANKLELASLSRIRSMYNLEWVDRLTNGTHIKETYISQESHAFNVLGALFS